MESDAENERIKIAEKNHKACAADLFVCFAYLPGIKLFSGDFPSYEKCYRGLKIPERLHIGGSRFPA